MTTIDARGNLHASDGQFSAQSRSAPAELAEPTHDLGLEIGHFIDAWSAYSGDDVGTFLAEWDDRLAPIDPAQLADAFESYDGDVDGFISAWQSGDRCPETQHGVHQVSDGSCDMCGAKNFA